MKNKNYIMEKKYQPFPSPHLQELLFIISSSSPSSGHPQVTFTALNPVTALHDPFLSLSLGEPRAPEAGHRGGGVTGVGLQKGRLTLTTSGGDGVHVYLRER